MISNVLIPFLDSHKALTREGWMEFDAAYAACLESIRHQWLTLFPPKPQKGSGNGKVQQVRQTLREQIATYEEGVRQLGELENEIMMYEHAARLLEVSEGERSRLRTLSGLIIEKWQMFQK
jgi:hypothetical protein